MGRQAEHAVIDWEAKTIATRAESEDGVSDRVTVHWEDRASWLAARKFIGDVDKNYRYWRSAEARCSRGGPLVLALVDELILEIATEAAERAQQR